MITENNNPKKDNTGPILIIAVILIIGVALLGFWLSPVPLDDDNPRIGDVWEFYGTGNPNNEDEIYRRRIIGIKGKYVQFIENDRDTLSRPIAVFRYHSKLIERSVILDTIPIVKDTIPIVKDTK